MAAADSKLGPSEEPVFSETLDQPGGRLIARPLAQGSQVHYPHCADRKTSVLKAAAG
jgi:hypothetical protein